MLSTYQYAHVEDIVRQIRVKHPELPNDKPVGIAGGFCRKSQVEQPPQKPMEIVCWATRASVDLEREVVLPGGLDTKSYFDGNKNLFVDHQYTVTRAVAHCRSMSMKDNGWICRGQMLDIDTEVSRAVVALARAGTLGMSIGFEPTNYGPPTELERQQYPGVENVIRSARVLEVSYTAMPMNVDCRMVATVNDQEKSKQAEAVLVKGGYSQMVYDLFRIARRNATVVILN